MYWWPQLLCRNTICVELRTWSRYLNRICSFSVSRCESTREQSQRESDRASLQRRFNAQPVCQQWRRVSVGASPRRLGLSSQPAARPSLTPLRFSFRAWKLTMLDTRRNPVRPPFISVSRSRGVILPVLTGALRFWTGVPVRPVWWLLPGCSSQRLPHRLHHSRSRARYWELHPCKIQS